jgi:hypothetical protein
MDHGINVLHIYELAVSFIMAVNPYRPTIEELQLSRRRVVYNTTIYLRYAVREFGESNWYICR